MTNRHGAWIDPPEGDPHTTFVDEHGAVLTLPNRVWVVREIARPVVVAMTGHDHFPDTDAAWWAWLASAYDGAVDPSRREE